MSKKLKPMVRLTKQQIEDKYNFVQSYIDAKNAASGSTVDANSNVTTKTVSTLGGEIFKDFAIQMNRYTIHKKICEMFNADLADEYIDLLERHIIYKHDETASVAGKPYCVAISMYPFLEHGLVPLGGESKAPKHLDSFCGSFINLVFAVASQFSGAVATPSLLIYFHYFAQKDYGKDYIKTHRDEVCGKFQHIV